ncbi:MAG: hypothetical protein Q9159_005464 [Coniocarpon cinnabarinum]
MLHPNIRDDGPVSFPELMALEKITETTFRSRTAAFAPGGALVAVTAAGNERKRTYGGHVFAQAVWAAAQTLSPGVRMVCHSVTGFFTLLGDPDLPFVYKVHEVRTGSSYAVRNVTVTQEDSRGTCFTCTASFKKPTHNPPNRTYQQDVDIESKYAEAIQGRKPWEHADYLNTEHPSFLQLPDDWKHHPSLSFPGLTTKKVNMTPYNARRPIEARRSLAYYTPLYSTMPSYAESPNLHICAHLYASDRNSLFRSADMVGVADWKAMASLSHTVLIHETDERASVAENGEGKWMCQEAWTDRLADGRVTHFSRIWKGGVHLASTVQDGMLRVQEAGSGSGSGSRL